jgi:hypothetical protein
MNVNIWVTAHSWRCVLLDALASINEASWKHSGGT